MNFHAVFLPAKAFEQLCYSLPAVPVTPCACRYSSLFECPNASAIPVELSYPFRRRARESNRCDETCATDSTDLGLFCGGPQVVPHELVRPPRFAGKRTDEDPTSFQQRIGHPLPMTAQNVCKIRVQWQPLFRALGLHILHSAVGPGPLDFDSQTFPVEIFPTQPKHFTGFVPNYLSRRESGSQPLSQLSAIFSANR
jgi:hypothetical protein